MRPTDGNPPTIGSSRPALGSVDWANATRVLLESGGVQIKYALGEAERAALLEARTEPWHQLPEYEGVVRQIGSGAYGTVDATAPVVAEMASEITTAISRAVRPRHPAPPTFNEVSWSHYPHGRGHITAHRDPDAFGGLIAIFALIGSATFRLWPNNAHGTPTMVATRDRPSDWTVDAGDLVLIRGNRWPGSTDRCPVHEALVPAQSERVIMTLRSNANGPGGGYAV
jgi:hypothetical protein